MAVGGILTCGLLEVKTMQGGQGHPPRPILWRYVPGRSAWSRRWSYPKPSGQRTPSCRDSAPIPTKCMGMPVAGQQRFPPVRYSPLAEGGERGPTSLRSGSHPKRWRPTEGQFLSPWPVGPSVGLSFSTEWRSTAARSRRRRPTTCYACPGLEG